MAHWIKYRREPNGRQSIKNRHGMAHKPLDNYKCRLMAHCSRNSYRRQYFMVASRHVSSVFIMRRAFDEDIKIFWHRFERWHFRGASWGMRRRFICRAISEDHYQLFHQMQFIQAYWAWLSRRENQPSSSASFKSFKPRSASVTWNYRSINGIICPSHEIFCMLSRPQSFVNKIKSIMRSALSHWFHIFSTHENIALNSHV